MNLKKVLDGGDISKLTRDDVQKLAFQFFAKQYNKKVEDLTEDDRISEQSGFDYIDAAEFILNLECELNLPFELNDEETESLDSIKEVIDYIMDKINNYEESQSQEEGEANDSGNEEVSE